jgi:hypothetical protein
MKKLGLETAKMNLEYIEKTLEENPYKAFIVIHAALHHQMQILIRYGYENVSKYPGDHPAKWKLITKETFRTFSSCVNSLFIISLISKKLRDKLLKFNTDRNKIIGHIDVYKQDEPTIQTITKICRRGILLIKELDKDITYIFFERKN